MRHIEIIANGGIPLFENIQDCPKYTMTMYPKHLFARAHEIIATAEPGSAEAQQLAAEMLAWGKTHLTTTALAARVLRLVGVERPARVLFLAGHGEDYMADAMFIALHESPLVQHITSLHPYDYLFEDFDQGRRMQLYGRGFTFSGRLRRREGHMAVRSLEEIKKTLEEGGYDLVVFGSIHRESRLLDEAVARLGARVVVIDGEDTEPLMMKAFELGGTYFKRELGDSTSRELGVCHEAPIEAMALHSISSPITLTPIAAAATTAVAMTDAVSVVTRCLYPISFAAHPSVFVDQVPEKLHKMSQNAIASGSWAVTSEQDYYNSYRQAVFGTTRKKAGNSSLFQSLFLCVCLRLCVIVCLSVCLCSCVCLSVRCG